jgi:YidC/Oxa1 family membrane protein insertase
MLNIFYTIIIYPIYQIIEAVYMLFYKLFNTASLSIIGVSAAVTFLGLPLYVVAEKWQFLERETQKVMKRKIGKIKEVFKGDEQYMILSAYYRQNHYHPVYALRNSFGILIQIPFFIAAYSFISHLEALKGASFLFIRDLSSPDELLRVATFTVNVLPAAMTLINCASGFIYTRGLPARDKIQIYGIALIFLFILYNSPSGLVLYWTMNNVFSLLKNIFYKLKNPLRDLYIVISIFVLLAVIYLLFFMDGKFIKRAALSAVLSVILLLPFIIRFFKYMGKTFGGDILENPRLSFRIFILSGALLVILAGLSIPTSSIASSPEEFSFIDSYSSPFPFVLNTFLQAAGLFLFWPGCIYFLFNKKTKAVLSLLFLFVSFPAILNAYFFQGNYSTLSNIFTFDSLGAITASGTYSGLNILASFFIFAILLVVLKFRKTIVIISYLGVITFSLALLSGYNLIKIYTSHKNYASIQDNYYSFVRSIKPIFSLSKKNQNIIIIMSDCARSGFARLIFDEFPLLEEQFDGFTLYSNTVSFSLHTLMGVPPIWGGYEYTPKEMNSRTDVPLVEKHNQALLVLPKLFSDAGYEVTVTDPSWANYASINDTSIYDAYERVTAFNTIGRYTGLWYEKNNFTQNQFTSGKIKRNALWFSFLKIAPPFLRVMIYDDGFYWSTDEYTSSITKFINSYAVMDFLPELTIYDSDVSRALFITNETTHDGDLTQYPDYIPKENVTDTGNGTYAKDGAYHGNAAFYHRLGEWLEELKKNGVYDNTRIIIVSDHGGAVNPKLYDVDIHVPTESMERYNPVLFVKDFYEHGKTKIDMTFMTNADVPVLALKTIAEPVNPFTGKVLSMESKKEGAYITINHLPQAHQHNKNTFRIEKNQWIFVKDNIFDEKSWKPVEQ